LDREEIIKVVGGATLDSAKKNRSLPQKITDGREAALWVGDGKPDSA